ncbi:beta-ketoacyl synthase N-terminal-like domain-containing protein [Streptomyces sp. 8N114]|uniref:beta-ketoacyl synthase N-terminal-like domain-containing protein n=1 Tax=Streptomyces sp. 8N114 TaxID=3457419 RepID=UPI003FCFDB8F
MTRPSAPDTPPAGWLLTGSGAVTSVGRGVTEVFEALCAGRDGLAPLRGFRPDRYRADSAYEIDDRPAPGQDVPLRATRWLVQAIEESLADAGLGDDLTGVPVIVGTGLRELRSAELSWRDGTPFDVTRLYFGTALRERFGATRTYTVSNACSASLYALAMGGDMLGAGVADTVVVAGVDTITESMFGLLDRVQLTPPERVRPFDRTRRGTLMGDGATAVVLCREGSATAARPCGRLRAVSLNCDAGHATAPDARSIVAAIRRAHTTARVKPEEIDLALLHGTGTPLNDEVEIAAMAEVFGAAVGHPLMTALKGATGHTSGGSGLLSLIIAARALATGRVPPALGLDDPAPGSEHFRFVPRAARVQPGLHLAQVNAFGFGGVNAVALLEGTT